MIDLMSVISKRSTAEVIRLSAMIREYAELRESIAKIEAEQQFIKTSGVADSLDNFTVDTANRLKHIRDENVEFLEKRRTAELNNLDVCNERLGLYLRFLSFHKSVCAAQVSLFVAQRHYKNAKQYLTFLSKHQLQLDNREEFFLHEKEKLVKKYEAACKQFGHPLLTLEEVEDIGLRFKGGMHNPSFLKLVSDKELDELCQEYNISTN